MSEQIAVKEREFGMSRFLNEVKQSIGFHLRGLRLKFTRRITLLARRVQMEGTMGDDIALFQERFNRFAARHDISIPVSSVYDETTILAVAEFQRIGMYVLDADGFVGPQTAGVLHIKLLEDK